MKELRNFEDAIRAQLGNEGTKLPAGFVSDFFANVKQLLIEEGRVSFGELGSFQYQVKEDSKPKITFIPSSYLRQELVKNDSAMQPVIERPQPERREEASSKMADPIKNRSDENLGVREIVSELAPADIKQESREANDDTINNAVLSNDTSVPLEQKKKPVYIEPNEEEEKKGGSARIWWYIILIVIILLALGFWAYKQQYFNQFLGQFFAQEQSQVSKVEGSLIPEGCLACETLGNNETLLGLATKYYGNSCYWVYIFLENRQELKYQGSTLAHTSIRIPNLDGYGVTNPKESDSIKRALALGNELWGSSVK